MKVEILEGPTRFGTIRIKVDEFFISMARVGKKIHILCSWRHDKERFEDLSEAEIPKPLRAAAYRVAGRAFTRIPKKGSVVTPEVLAGAERADYRHRMMLGDDY